MKVDFTNVGPDIVPVLLCDHCGLPITETSKALVKWWSKHNPPLVDGCSSL
jgi:hypothetical protein